MKTYHWIIAIITLPIFIIGFGSSAWTLFSTITERSGFSGTVYSNYDISKFTFSLITFINALLFGGMVTIQYLNLWRRNPKGLNQSYIISAICVVIIILLEYYLHLNFVGKG